MLKRRKVKKAIKIIGITSAMIAVGIAEYFIVRALTSKDDNYEYVPTYDSDTEAIRCRKGLIADQIDFEIDDTIRDYMNDMGGLTLNKKNTEQLREDLFKDVALTIEESIKDYEGKVSLK